MVEGLTFDEESHVYRMRGRPVVSVSRVLEPLQEFDGVPLPILRAAAQFGRHVHKAVDLWNAKRLDIDALDPALRPYLDGWIAFMQDTASTIVESERAVFHPKLRYAGRLDTILSWDGAHKLVDVKTSAAVPRTVGYQTAAYSAAYMSEGHKLHRDRYCVHLTGNGRYRLHKYNDPSDMHMFQSALNLYPYFAKRKTAWNQ